MAKSQIATAYVQVIPTTQGIKSRLTSGMSDAGDSAGGIFGGNLVGSIKKIIATAGLGKLLGEALTAGADLQQSIGGVETLFKDSADTVIQNAEQAYKTAGMSANEYMETVTSFSASLLQGLSGNTEAAASISDMALRDMSDNYNKFGSDMESIQNAYQGFAKQNYTMLDNLKLGYGGTKTEMERLLNDAQKLTGVKYDISNLADVYSAIHVIQEEMHISGLTAEEAAEMVAAGLMTEEEAFEALGTTAKEASYTFSGSLASMKSAFSNLLANLSTGRDIGPSLTALGETVFTFVQNNLLPMVGNIFTALPETLSSLLSMAIRGLNLAADNADALVKMGTDLMTGLGSAIITALPNLAKAAVNIVTSLGTAILSTDWIQLGTDTINSLRESLDLAAGEILGTDGNIVQSVLDAISARLPDILEFGGTMVSSLISGIFSMLPRIAESALNLAVRFITELIANLPNILRAGQEILGSVVDGIRSCLPDLLASAGEAIGELLTGIVQNLPSILAAGIDLVTSLIEGIGLAAPDLLAGAGALLQNILTAVANINWVQLGKDIISGLINGIGSMAGALWTAAENVAKSALDAIKKFFGIASPSKVMRDQVGKFIPSGLAVGIEANTKPLTDAMHDLSDLTTDSLVSSLRIDTGNNKAPTFRANDVTGRSVQVVQYIYSEAKTAADLMQEAQYQQERAVLLGV